MEAKTREKEYPLGQQLNVWQTMIAQEDFRTAYGLIDSLYRLPREPWPEPLRAILLKICDLHMARVDSIRSGYQIERDPKVEGESIGNLYEMVVWQADRRFIPFLADFGGHLLSSRGLAAIGEPAFDVVIEALHRSEYPSAQFAAAKALELMMEKEHGFLRPGQEKREIARKALLRVVRSEDELARMGAIDALKHFPDQEIISLLDSLSQHDTYTVNGRYPVRKRAQEAMQFIRSQGDDKQ